MDRKQYAALANPSLVALCFVLRDPKSQQSADDSANRSQRARARQRRKNRTRRNQRSEARNGQRADAGQPSQYSAGNAARNNSCGGAFRRFRVLLVRKILGALVFRKEDGNIRAPEARGAQMFDGLFRRRPARLDPEH